MVDVAEGINIIIEICVSEKKSNEPVVLDETFEGRSPHTGGGLETNGTAAD